MGKITKKEAVGIILACIYVFMDYTSKHGAMSNDFDQDDLYAGNDIFISKNLEEKKGYENRVKPALDKGLSFCGLILLSPLYIVIAAAVYLSDPGHVFFTQERVGRNKRLFRIHKFRTMKMDTPHDVPTHMLENPEQYIIKAGRVLRKYSLDELPQIWDIFRGKMSVIGPRPALWNQKDLITERDKYGANDIMPGLTGWAQINGRDGLEIVRKAQLDGEYAKRLKKGGFRAFLFDCKCFLGTISVAFKHDGVIEGGTGSKFINSDAYGNKRDRTKNLK